MKELLDNKTLQILIVFIALDVIFGVLRAIKEKKLNSTIGIDGIIRKVAMISTIIVCIILDYLVKINFIAFIPSDITSSIGIEKIGISELFGILYIKRCLDLSKKIIEAFDEVRNNANEL